jgi:FlaA1/EpsC-like NDP-sugar epimerase
LNTGAHLVLFAFTWLCAFGLAYNFRRFDQWFTTFFLSMLPIVLVIKLIVFGQLGLFRGAWRYVSMRDLFQISRASWISTVLLYLLYYVSANASAVASWLGFKGIPDLLGGDFPDSVFLLDVAGTIAVISGARMGVRLYHEEVQPLMEGSAPKLLILGAGNAADSVVREIERQPVLEYRIIGFLDDDPAKQGSHLRGYEVLGPISRIKAICESYSVDEILIAMPSATRTQVRRVVETCQGTNLRFKTLPAMADLISGRAEVREIRDVDIHDLLGRAPVNLNEDEIGKFIKGRAILVTGAGGSIGAEMCRQIARFAPKRLALIEQAEQNLFEIERELRQSFSHLEVVPYIADIADAGRIRAVFEREQPSGVIHAAAHKHVPMMEHNPGEAFKNNIRGTRVVADEAARVGAEKFVMISTDKAVNPTSIMGGSKRVAEMYIQGLNERVDTQFVTVRFGNVLGSSGSVVPIFQKQIVDGGPVTVTHPEMVRYFMTIPEASQLVLQAASMGAGGEIFVLDMGEPVRILDLARDLITLSGYRPDEDIEIRFTGMRPGEKLFEELSIAGEDVSHTSHPKIGIWRKRQEDWNDLVQAMEQLVADADGLSREQARVRLRAIVPEFHLDSPENPNGSSVATSAPDAIAPTSAA